MKILSIGEVLWDVIGGEEHLGGAPLNFAAHARRLGNECWLLSAVGDDERGRRARAEIERLGVETRYLDTSLQADTGIATVSARPDGTPEFQLLRPSAYDFLKPGDELLADSFDAICYGTLLQTFEPARRATMRVLTTFPKAIRFYDVNLRTGNYTLQLVEELMAHATVLKLNEAEAAVLTGAAHPVLRDFCEAQARLFNLDAVAVTRGENGCAVLVRGEFVEVPGIPVRVADTVGSGDAFGAAFLHGLSHGWPALRVAEFANSVGALVASRSGAIPKWSLADLQSVGEPQ